jgi:hypothetical protein
MNWYDLILGAIIGAIVSLIISYIFLIKGTEKKIQYEIKSFNLITEKISEKISNAPSLKILYGKETNSEDVKVLTSSIIKIENSGYNAIKYSDIAPDDPLRIVVKDPYKLYFTREIDEKGKANNFFIESHNEKYVDIEFSHLNPKDGIKIQIFHSGNSNEENEIRGTIIGGPKIKEKPEWKKNIGKSLIVPIVSILISVLIIYSVFQLFIQSMISTQVGIIAFTILFICFIVFFVYILSLLLVSKIHDYIDSNWLKKRGW